MSRINKILYKCKTIYIKLTGLTFEHCDVDLKSNYFDVVDYTLYSIF